MKPRFIFIDIIVVAGRLWSQKSLFNKFTLFVMYLKFRLNASFYRRFPRPEYTGNIFGNSIAFNSYETFLYSFKEIFIYQVYRFTTTQMSPTIIDCGSNIGLSVLFFKLICPDAKVLSFEPEPLNVGFLQRNVCNNQLENVLVYPLALSNKVGEELFRKNNVEEGSLRGSLFSWRGNENTIKVQTDMLSQYINEPVALVKMDIEGAELLVIEELILKDKMHFIDQLILEYHQVKEGADVQVLIDLMKKNNHNCKVLPFGEVDLNNEVQDILIHSQQSNS